MASEIKNHFEKGENRSNSFISSDSISHAEDIQSEKDVKDHQLVDLSEEDREFENTLVG
jgi:hypothetical protein